jgi:hypothetical protein
MKISFLFHIQLVLDIHEHVAIHLSWTDMVTNLPQLLLFIIHIVDLKILIVKKQLNFFQMKI